MKRKYRVMIVLMILLFISVEARPVKIVSSTVFTTQDETAIKLHVIANTVLGINEKKIMKDVIQEHQKINGKRKNESYTLVLYRTALHYRKNLEYNTLVCDKNTERIKEGL